jgi:hypothetical protein
MEELINEIKISLPFNYLFYDSINKDEVLHCIKRCKSIDHVNIFIRNVIDLEEKLINIPFQELINEKYTYEGLDEPLFKELLDCRLYVKEILTGVKYNYTQPLTKGFYERLYIRIVLLKEGWKPLNIETFLKNNYSLKWDIIRYKFTYIYLRSILNIKEKPQLKGRPKIPESLKEYIKPKLKEKNKERMKTKYDISKDLNKLFTKEDIILLKTQNRNNITLNNKLDILSKYTL